MPLPSALLARLAKRGLLEKKDAPVTEETNENEEVFAEDYDDPSKEEEEEESAPVVPIPETPIEENTNNNVTGTEPIFRETPACPLRSNPYHLCVPYCKKTYGMLEWQPDVKMLKRKERMLARYPLPDGWVEVGDPVTNRYYYWNLLTDQVSWLSPSHPRADVTQSAEQLGLLGKVGLLDSDGEEAMETMDSDHEDDDSQRSGSDTSLSDEEEEVPKPPLKTESRLFRAPPPEPPKQESRKGRGKAEDLDPMDPASYSDIARGGWNDGLDLRGKAKTGVDETASGPLFQQRPYPSPGDILRANQSLKKKK